MLGHQLIRRLVDKFDLWTTVRKSKYEFNKINIIKTENIFENVDCSDFNVLHGILQNLKPDVIINAVGVIKQRTEINDRNGVLSVNSLLPHRLAAAAREVGSRLICIGTDCVFAGTKGNYAETAIPDAADFYGQSKIYGEVYGENCLTLRTSIIGRELTAQNGLLEWFLSNQGKTVKGFNRAVFSGFSTIALADILAKIIENRELQEGLYHLASQPISKYDLLSLIKESFKLDAEIERDDEFQIDRSLDGGKFNREFNYEPPSWEEMIEQLAQDNDFYERTR